ncbi:bifunctional oligoribonuclease/PAP phosphatase NrnA [bacterium]|nr:bifunctional oligoribonuclease/PAP phosphatase NrnA [bacterium]
MGLLEAGVRALAVTALEQAKTVVIASHIDPDGDALGSSLALALILQKMGKDVTVYNRDAVPYSYSFLPGSELVSNRLPPECDLLCLLDCSEFERAGEMLSAWSGYSQSLCIDHHLTVNRSADINLIYSDACATGELIYELAMILDPSFGLEVAANIYTAILTDTGSFRYSNATPSSFAIAGDLVARGVEPWEITQQVYESQPLERIKLTALVLETLQIANSKLSAAVWVTKEMFEKTGTNSEYTDGLVNYPRSIAGVEVAFMAREIGPEEYKFSFRSRGRVNVAELVAGFSGGGHHNAAGCRLKGNLVELIEQFFALVDEQFQNIESDD